MWLYYAGKRKVSIWWIHSAFFCCEWAFTQYSWHKVFFFRNGSKQLCFYDSIVWIKCVCVYVQEKGLFDDWLRLSSSERLVLENKQLPWQQSRVKEEGVSVVRFKCWDDYWQREWRGSLRYILWSCAIPAANQVSALLLFLSPALLSCCRSEVSERLQGEQTLNVNETAERKLIFFLCLALTVLFI